MIIVAGLIVFVLNANNGVTKDETHGQVRMKVDPNVLPIIQPDNTDILVEKTPEPNSASTESREQESVAEPETPATVEQEAPASAPALEQEPVIEPAPPAKPATSGIIKSIKLSETDTGFVITVLADKPIGDTSYMNFSNPHRLVVDLREPWIWKNKNVIRSKNGPVKHIVLGPHPDRLRMVIYFRVPLGGKLKPQFKREGNSLKVSVSIP
jgi:hypothetical protein